MAMTVIDENYLNQKLEWVKYRLEMLDQIEEKLIDMRQLAEYVRDNKLSSQQIKVANAKLRKGQQEVDDLDNQSKTFLLDVQ